MNAADAQTKNIVHHSAAAGIRLYHLRSLLAPYMALVQIMMLDHCCVVSLVEHSPAPPAVMGTLCMAMATRFDTMPLTSTLLVLFPT